MSKVTFSGRHVYVWGHMYGVRSCDGQSLPPVNRNAGSESFQKLTPGPEQGLIMKTDTQLYKLFSELPEYFFEWKWLLLGLKINKIHIMAS